MTEEMLDLSDSIRNSHDKTALMNTYQQLETSKKKKKILGLSRETEHMKILQLKNIT